MKSARRYLVWFSFLALAFVIGLTIFLVQKHDSLDRSKMEKIQIGMSYDQVVETLKCPPGDYSDGQNSPPFYFYYELHHYRDATVWVCNGAELYVFFDNDNNAIVVNIFNTDRSKDKSLFNRLKTKLGF